MIVEIVWRKGHVCETIYTVNHIVLDKTGTLTTGNIHIDQTTLSPFAIERELSTLQCLNIAAGLEQHANHPIAKAFRDKLDTSIEFTQVNNVIGSGLSGFYQDEEWRIGTLEFALMHSEQTLLEPSSKTSAIYLTSNGQLIASFEYSDPIRPETPDFIQAIQSKGLDITILTGDTESSASKVANNLGVKDYVFQAKPEDKLHYLKELNKTKITLMIGDGINDAPTLAGSHLSVAMGGGSDVAKASADMVLLGDRLDRILEARQLALFTRRIIRQNLAWALGYNLIILPLAVMGLVAPYIAVLGMSTSSIIVVTNSLRLLK